MTSPQGKPVPSCIPNHGLNTEAACRDKNVLWPGFNCFIFWDAPSCLENNKVKVRGETDILTLSWQTCVCSLCLSPSLCDTFAQIKLKVDIIFNSVSVLIHIYCVIFWLIKVLVFPIERTGTKRWLQHRISLSLIAVLIMLDPETNHGVCASSLRHRVKTKASECRSQRLKAVVIKAF